MSDKPSQLPLEITAAIARELGEDVFRLRRDVPKLPIDLSQDLILYNALAKDETHQRCNSIRRPLKELEEGEDAAQELREREALYWSHKRGCPRKLIASGDAAYHSTNGSNYHPILRHGYLVYLTWNDGARYVVQDLVRKKEWYIRDAGAVTITDTMLAFARPAEVGEHLFAVDLEKLGESGEIVLDPSCSYPDDENVLEMVGHEGAFFLSCLGWDRTLRLWKDGKCKRLATYVPEDHHGSTIGVESSFFHVRVLNAFELEIERFSFDGKRLPAIVLTLPNIEPLHSLVLRHTGETWMVIMDNINSMVLEGERWSRLMTWEKNGVMQGNVALWKGLKYEAVGDNVRVSRLEDDWTEQGQLIGDLRFVSTDLESAVLDIIVDDTFLVIFHRTHGGLRYFIFTFDDLDGVEVSREPALGQYYWLPR